MAGDLTIALAGVHVAHVDATTGDLHRGHENGAGTDGMDGQVSIGLVPREVVCGERIFMRRADEERAEIAGVVQVRDREVRGGGAELAEETAACGP